MRPIFLRRKNVFADYPEILIVGGIVLALVVLFGVIAPLERGERGKARVPCPPPQSGEELRVSGSVDGRPFCAYYPIKGYGAAP